jgi:hypothetical protein
MPAEKTNGWFLAAISAVWPAATALVVLGSLLLACGGRTSEADLVDGGPDASDASPAEADAPPADGLTGEGGSVRAWYCVQGTGVEACICVADSNGIALDQCTRPKPACCFMMGATQCVCVSLPDGAPCSPGGGAAPIPTCPPQ